jgi:hypothetical protein
MTMQDKIYFLLLALLLIAVQAASFDLYNPKGKADFKNIL